jgi:hypothetical protein
MKIFVKKVSCHVGNSHEMSEDVVEVGAVERDLPAVRYPGTLVQNHLAGL